MKRDLLIPLAVLFLMLIFGLISLLVYFRTSPKLIKYKLKLGALLLSLTVISSCGSNSQQLETCYKSATTLDSVQSTTKNNRAISDTTNHSATPKKKGEKQIQAEPLDTIIKEPYNQTIRCYAPPMDISEPKD